MCQECAKKVLDILEAMERDGEFSSEPEEREHNRQVMGIRIRGTLTCPQGEKIPGDAQEGVPDAGTHEFMYHFPAAALLMSGPSRALNYDVCHERYMAVYGGPKFTDDRVVCRQRAAWEMTVLGRSLHAFFYILMRDAAPTSEVLRAASMSAGTDQEIVFSAVELGKLAGRYRDVLIGPQQEDPKT